MENKLIVFKDNTYLIINDEVFSDGDLVYNEYFNQSETALNSIMVYVKGIDASNCKKIVAAHSIISDRFNIPSVI
jgi:hypothetical protein